MMGYQSTDLLRMFAGELSVCVGVDRSYPK